MLVVIRVCGRVIIFVEDKSDRYMNLGHFLKKRLVAFSVRNLIVFLILAWGPFHVLVSS